MITGIKSIIVVRKVPVLQNIKEYEFRKYAFIYGQIDDSPYPRLDKRGTTLTLSVRGVGAGL
jgi:hypothetical protein